MGGTADTVTKTEGVGRSEWAETVSGTEASLWRGREGAGPGLWKECIGGWLEWVSKGDTWEARLEASETS